ncbi:hypothetical protein HDV00_008320 [Rhizophlyctis rosea]|nr:hypothetical protein HDV00_008320 [Rhizophlyctis rosea]
MSMDRYEQDRVLLKNYFACVGESHSQLAYPVHGHGLVVHPSLIAVYARYVVGGGFGSVLQSLLKDLPDVTAIIRDPPASSTSSADRDKLEVDLIVNVVRRFEQWLQKDGLARAQATVDQVMAEELESISSRVREDLLRSVEQDLQTYKIETGESLRQKFESYKEEVTSAVEVTNTERESFAKGVVDELKARADHVDKQIEVAKGAMQELEKLVREVAEKNRRDGAAEEEWKAALAETTASWELKIGAVQTEISAKVETLSQGMLGRAEWEQSSASTVTMFEGKLEAVRKMGVENIEALKSEMAVKSGVAEVQKMLEERLVPFIGQVSGLEEKFSALQKEVMERHIALQVVVSQELATARTTWQAVADGKFLVLQKQTKELEAKLDANAKAIANLVRFNADTTMNLSSAASTWQKESDKQMAELRKQVDEFETRLSGIAKASTDVLTALPAQVAEVAGKQVAVVEGKLETARKELTEMLNSHIKVTTEHFTKVGCRVDELIGAVKDDRDVADRSMKGLENGLVARMERLKKEVDETLKREVEERAKGREVGNGTSAALDVQAERIRREVLAAAAKEFIVKTGEVESRVRTSLKEVETDLRKSFWDVAGKIQGLEGSLVGLTKVIETVKTETKANVEGELKQLEGMSLERTVKEDRDMLLGRIEEQVEDVRKSLMGRVNDLSSKVGGGTAAPGPVLRKRRGVVDLEAGDGGRSDGSRKKSNIKCEVDLTGDP